MALSPFIAFGAFYTVRPFNATAAMALGVLVMLTMALSAGGGKPPVPKSG